MSDDGKTPTDEWWEAKERFWRGVTLTMFGMILASLVLVKVLS